MGNLYGPKVLVAELIILFFTIGDNVEKLSAKNFVNQFVQLLIFVGMCLSLLPSQCFFFKKELSFFPYQLCTCNGLSWYILFNPLSISYFNCSLIFNIDLDRADPFSFKQRFQICSFNVHRRGIFIQQQISHYDRYSDNFGQIQRLTPQVKVTVKVKTFFQFTRKQEINWFLRVPCRILQRYYYLTYFLLNFVPLFFDLLFQFKSTMVPWSGMHDFLSNFFLDFSIAICRQPSREA